LLKILYSQWEIQNHLFLSNAKWFKCLLGSEITIYFFADITQRTEYHYTQPFYKIINHVINLLHIPLRWFLGIGKPDCLDLKIGVKPAIPTVSNYPRFWPNIFPNHNISKWALFMSSTMSASMILFFLHFHATFEYITI
jgi:hypothetical protein